MVRTGNAHSPHLDRGVLLNILAHGVISHTNLNAAQGELHQGIFT